MLLPRVERGEEPNEEAFDALFELHDASGLGGWRQGEVLERLFGKELIHVGRSVAHGCQALARQCGENEDVAAQLESLLATLQELQQQQHDTLAAKGRMEANVRAAKNAQRTAEAPRPHSYSHFPSLSPSHTHTLKRPTRLSWKA